MKKLLLLIGLVIFYNFPSFGLETFFCKNKQGHIYEMNERHDGCGLMEEVTLEEYCGYRSSYKLCLKNKIDQNTTQETRTQNKINENEICAIKNNETLTMNEKRVSCEEVHELVRQGDPGAQLILGLLYRSEGRMSWGQDNWESIGNELVSSSAKQGIFPAMCFVWIDYYTFDEGIKSDAIHYANLLLNNYNTLERDGSLFKKGGFIDSTCPKEKLQTFLDEEENIEVQVAQNTNQLPKCEIENQKVITKTACYGTITGAYGEKYVGEFRDGKYNGQGTITYVNENKYVGEFRDGKYNGQGTRYGPYGIQRGEWENNRFVKESDITQVEEVQVAQNTTQETKTTTPKKKTEQVVVTTSNLDKKSLKEELKYWKELFEDELITQKEYDAKRKALLEGGVTTTQVTTTVVEPEPKDNVKRVTVDMSYKNKNYLKKSLLNQKKWGKISNYCDSNYKKFWEYQECEAQNTKAYKMYNKAKNIYDIYISYGELLSFQVLGGEISEQQARYYYETKREELAEAYRQNKSAKWNNFVNNMMKIENTFNNFNRNQTVPQYAPTMNGHRICQLQHSGGNAAVSNIICF